MLSRRGFLAGLTRAAAGLALSGVALGLSDRPPADFVGIDPTDARRAWVPQKCTYWARGEVLLNQGLDADDRLL